MDEVEGALEIDGDDGVPLLLGHAHHETVLGDAGVVDKNVDVAEVFVDFLHDGFRFGEVGGIAGIGAAGDAYGFYFFTRGFETGGHVVVEYEVCECNVSAFAGKLEGEGLADTAGGTGD